MKKNKHIWAVVFVFVGAIAFGFFICQSFSIDLAFTIAFSLLFLLILLKSLKGALILGIVFFYVKSFFLRIIYYFEQPILGMQGKFSIHALFGLTGGLFLIIAFAVFIIKNLVSHRSLVKYPLDRFVIVYMIYCFLQIFNPSVPLMVGLAGFERAVIPSMGMYFLARVVFENREDVYRFLKVISIYAVLSLAYGLLQSLGALTPFDRYWVASGQGWSNQFLGGSLRVFAFSSGPSGFLFPIVGIAIILMMVGKYMGTKARRLQWMFWVLLLVFFVVNLPRTAVAMLVVGFVTSLIFVSGKGKIFRNALFVLMVVVAMYMLLAPRMKMLSLYSLNPRIKRVSELANPLEAVTVQERIKGPWRVSIQTARSFPMGKGIGNASSTRATHGKYRYLLFGPHNEYLQKLIELGIPGFILFMLLLWKMIAVSVRYVLVSQESFTRRLSGGILGIVLSYMACGIVNIPISANAILFWFFVGLLPLLSKLEANPLNRSLILQQDSIQLSDKDHLHQE